MTYCPEHKRFHSDEEMVYSAYNSFYHWVMPGANHVKKRSRHKEDICVMSGGITKRKIGHVTKKTNAGGGRTLEETRLEEDTSVMSGGIAQRKIGHVTKKTKAGGN